ncbi:hypothetical protein ACIBBG_32750 [Micromonospora chersina]|uniref:hypothetical protein n=1 Tax=Micromonospora chersina TaxID=47854 RepID=UPI00379F2DA3
MSNRGDIREQPSNSDPASPPPPAGWGYLTLAATSAAGYGVAYAFDNATPVDLGVGAYGAAMMVFIAGVGGYVARAAEARLHRAVGHDVAGLRTTVDSLRDQVDFDELLRRVEALAEQRYQDGHADGFVDGAAACEAPRVVRGIGGGRSRPRLTSDS